jgi:hypothetical protein
MLLNIGANSPHSTLTETVGPHGARQSWVDGLSRLIKDQPHAPDVGAVADEREHTQHPT